MAMDNGSAADERGGLSTATKTTLLYLVVGFGLLLTGWWVQPRFQARSIKAELQSVLFPKLEDVAQAGSLEIVSYNEELAELSPFKVVKTGGVWVLPAHDNYPADAQEHLAAAATELIDMKPLDVMSESPADHETFGVIEPDPQKIEAGMTGVGKLLEIRDEAGTALARLVVGKEDRQPAGAAGGTRLLRFVRISGQDPVYRVEIDTSKLTTRFGDWIEKDLLKLSPWDVRNVTLDDYALAAVQAEGRMMVEQQRQSRVQLAYNDQDAEWSLTSLEVFNPEDSTAEPEMVTLGDDQELDTAKLNDLRNALGDLKIIDVARKPAGLTADLEAEASFLDDDEAVRSMQQRGFLPLSSGEILSTDGETVVGMKDGVEYVLRFGAGTSVVQTGEDAGEVGERSEVPGRYLLVMARFNESLLEKPVLEPVPGEEPAETTEPETTEPETTEPETTDGSSFSRSGPFRLVAQADDDAAVAGEAAEQGSAEEPSGGDESADAEDGPPSPAPSAAEALQAADEAEAKAQAAREERRRVERENRRRQEEYDEQVESGKKRVRELNGRFAAWYYIVSDEEYAKIHLSQADVVREAGAAETDPAAAGGLGLPNTPGFALPPAGQ
ncbi:MAG: DUF4340 domain-containing protein [Pirellulales bacterium]|nr:DUF4340 domain-containing protein [Pirellulales bacterium]